MINIGVFAFGIENRFEEYLEMFHSGEVETIDVMADFLLSGSDRELEKCGRALQERKISVNAVHASWEERSNLGSLDRGVRDSAIALNKVILQKMRILKANILVVHPGRKAEEEDVRIQGENFVDSLGRLLPEAEKIKISIAVENMLPSFPGTGAEGVEHLLESLSSPCLGICFDLGHAHVNSEVVEEFEVAPDEIITMHLHDNDGNQDMHMQPGYGTIDWTGFAESFKKSNNQSALIIEAFPWQGREVGWMKQEVERSFK